MENIAVGDGALRAVRPDQVIEAVDALQIHRDALDAVGDLAGHRIALEPARLLEVRELRDFHAVQPHFPAETPCAQRGRFPVVLDETDVVHRGVDAHVAQGFDEAVLEIVR